MTTDNDYPYEKMMRLYIEAQSDMYAKMNTYTNLVMAGGYVGAFALWSFARPILSTKGTALLAALLGISITSFFTGEIYKMVRGFIEQRRYNKFVEAAKTPQEWITKYHEMQKMLAVLDATVTVPFWAISLIISVLTVVVAALILFYDCGAVLFGFCPWP